MRRTWLPLVPMELVVVDGPSGAELRGPVPPQMLRCPIYHGNWSRLAEQMRKRPWRAVMYHRRTDDGFIG